MSREAPCKHFNTCGGCSLQELNYQEQLIQKQQELSRIFGKEIIVHAAPQEFYYRGKIDFIIAYNKLSLRGAGKSWQTIPITDCLLISDSMNILAQEVQVAIDNSNFTSYDLKSKKGFLRYLTIRETRTKENMLVFVTTTPSQEQENLFKEFLQQFSVTSTYWLISDSQADDNHGEVKLFYGEEYLMETINDLQFKLYPGTFFQSNREVAELLFKKIREHVTGKTLDMYCGVGSISLTVADKASSVFGVEEYEPSIQLARENATLNNITNATFMAEPAFEYVRHALVAKETFDTVIVDPPRTGLGHKVAKALSRFQAKKIVYMSCNPKTLRDDLASLQGYKLISLEGYDMFPQTPHVECLAILEKET